MWLQTDPRSAWRNRILCLTALAPILWLIAVTAWGGVYSFPQTDDFCTFGRLFTHDAYNPLADVWRTYLTWTGRYASVFMVASAGWLSSVAPWPIHVTYQALVVMLTLVFVAGCVVAMGALSASRFVNVAVACIAGAAALTFMPSRLEGVYWLSGAAIYVTSVAVFLALARSIARDDLAGEGSIGARRPYASVALIVFCVGFNELIALSIGGFLLLRVVFFAKGSVYRKRNIAYGIAYAASMLLTVCAPGNFARDAISQLPRHELAGAWRLALHSMELFIDSRTAADGKVLFAMLAGTAAFTWAMKPSGFMKFRRIAPMALTLLVAMPTHLYAYSFLTGEETPGRIINQCYSMTLVGACVLAAWAGSAVASVLRMKPSLRTACAVLLAVGLMFLTTDQFRRVVETIRDFGPVWRSEHLQRIEALRAGRGGSVTLAPFSPEDGAWPLFEGADITSDPSYWVNTCMSGVYGVKDVRLKAPKAE